MRKLCVLLIAVLLMTGCDNTPEGVLGEKDLASLMVDMHKAEAYINLNYGRYYNDSMKLAVKQSVLMNHDVTEAEYDSTLVWYGHHVDKYTKVYDKVIAELQSQQKELQKEATNPGVVAKTSIASSKKRYPAKGDTADIWTKDRTWAFMGSIGKNVVTFSYPPTEAKRGDQYKLSFKMCNVVNSFKVYFGIDYTDGSTSFVSRLSSIEGWNYYTLQSDSTKSVRRIYGFIEYRPKPRELAYADSVEIVRTRLNSNSYSVISSQSWYGKTSARTGVKTEKPTEGKKEAEKSYSPKPGLNKSGVERRMELRPNGQQLPPPKRERR